MINLTSQERAALLFLIALGLVGLGMRIAAKLNTRNEFLIMNASRDIRINLNEASLEDLLRTRLVSPKLAQKLIEFRNARGALRDLQELKELKGVGKQRYEKLEELFYVE